MHLQSTSVCTLLCQGRGCACHSIYHIAVPREFVCTCVLCVYQGTMKYEWVGRTCGCSVSGLLMSTAAGPRPVSTAIATLDVRREPSQAQPSHRHSFLRPHTRSRFLSISIPNLLLLLLFHHPFTHDPNSTVYLSLCIRELPQTLLIDRFMQGSGHHLHTIYLGT